MKKVYDVVQVVFGNTPNWKPGMFEDRVIATCKNRALAQGVVARNRGDFHAYKIVERCTVRKI